MSGLFQKDQVFWDKVFVVFIIVVWFSWLVLMALDAKRWGFSQMPAAFKAVGAVLIPIGFFIVRLTFREVGTDGRVSLAEPEVDHEIVACRCALNHTGICIHRDCRRASLSTELVQFLSLS